MLTRSVTSATWDEVKKPAPKRASSVKLARRHTVTIEMSDVIKAKKLAEEQRDRKEAEAERRRKKQEAHDAKLQRIIKAEKVRNFSKISH